MAVEEREADWLVTVTDNALGIPAEQRESIFTMYARVDGGAPGHGIGLAACRQIVERHGGTIWVDANPVGRGQPVQLHPPALTGPLPGPSLPA